jgi:hypothetical protein
MTTQRRRLNPAWAKKSASSLRSGTTVRMSTWARQHFLLGGYDAGLKLTWTNLGGGVWEARVCDEVAP